MVTRLQAYLEMVDTTPPRLEPSPGIRNTKMSDVTAQVSVELGSASGVPRHQQTAGMANHERNTFDRNLASHHQLFAINTSTSSSTRPAPVPLTQLMDQAPSDDEDDAMTNTDAQQEAPKSCSWMLTPWKHYQVHSSLLRDARDQSTPRVRHTATQVHLRDLPMFTWCPFLKSAPMGTQVHR